MEAKSLRIRKFRLTKEQLNKLSDSDRELFFLAGHILNELNSLNNVVSWCLRSGGSADAGICRMARGVQAMIYARLLAGKLSEAWQVLGTTWFARKLSPAFEAKLHSDSRAALAEIKSYFSRTNLVFTVRNSFAFHYSAGMLSEHWADAAEGDNLELVIGGTISNNLNLASEVLVNAAVLRLAHPTSLEAGLDKFLNEVQAMASHFTTFFEGVTVVLMGEMLGERFAEFGVEEVIAVSHSYKDVHIPYFCLHDEQVVA